MKTLILSSLLILVFASTNHGKPINDIYSIKDPIVDEEVYVDDIPFNTWEIAVNAMIDGDEANLAEEPYVDDIPFDTEKVMYQELAKRLTEMYRDEQNTCDLSEKDFTIIDNEQGSRSYLTMKALTPKKSMFRYK